MRVPQGILALVGTLAAACVSIAVGTSDAARPAAGRLSAFSGCPSFVEYVKQQALPLVGPGGIAGGGGGPIAMPDAARGRVSGQPAVGADDYSGTNVQEEGVDEPDIVKTDGRTLFVASGGRISAFDVRLRRPRLVGKLKLEIGDTHELLLYRDRLLVLSNRGLGFPGDTARIRAPWPIPSHSAISEIDVRDPGRMRLVRTLELEGSYLTARLVGRSARIVLSTPLPVELPFPPATGDSAAMIARNRATVRTSGAGSWLPGYTVRRAGGDVVRKGRLVECRNIRRPPGFSGLGLTTVATIDLERGLDPVDSDAVVSSGRIVYASRSRLYVATERWDRRLAEGRPIPGETTTAIHAFDISSPAATHYRASGTVTGTLLSQWSLSERAGVLRVASTDQPLWFGGPRTESETFVTTLDERGGTLATLGRVGGLGKGERVYAVRFVGDIGYVVTFRQVDPLYTLDLSIPSRPTVRGELKIRGYSAYLHPVGDDLLLGIGQDATDEGRVLGVQASLFDVSDLRAPKRLDAFSLGKAWSLAEQDHHAFLWWPATRLAVLPIQAYDDRPFAGALGLRVRRAGITEVARLAHPALPGPAPVGSPGAPILRSLVVRDALLTVSEAGVRASSLQTFADLGFARGD